MTATKKTNVRTSGDLTAKEESALVLGDFSQEDSQAASELGIVLHGSFVDCINRAVAAQNSASLMTLEAGYLLLRAKQKIPHGEFDRHLKERGMARQRASELMRTAKFYTSLPPERRREVFVLGKSKMLLLADADQEVIEDVLNDPAAGLGALSVRGLRQLVTKPEHEKADLKSALETAALKQKQRDSARSRLTQYLPRTEEVRSECMALQIEVELPLDGLRKLFDEVNAESADLPEHRLQLEQLWITAHVMAARAADLLNHLYESVDSSDMPERVRGEHMLTDEEAEHWLREAQTMRNAYG